jgi:hypothetical protein
MALPGMKSTADFNTDENPQTWREGILRLSPRNGSPLFALTSMMKSERTTSPEFNWWEEPLFMYTFTVNGALLAGATTVVVDSDALRLKPGDVLRCATSGEHIRVLTVTSDTTFTVERARGAVGSAAGTAAGIADNSYLIYVGSAYREGAPRSVGTSTAPVKKTNFTQIFRDPVEITRTAQQTSTFRTGDPFKNDRERTSHKHALGIERAFWFGSPLETMESSQPIRYTGGITSFIDPSKIITVSGAVLDMDEFLGLFTQIFEFGSGEKLVFASLFVQTLMANLVRKNGQYQWGPPDKEYGIDVRRFYTPAGTLVLTEHPMFSATKGLSNDMFVIDTANIRYRHLQDTTYLKNRQSNDVDGQADEFLTEAGLEVHHGLTHAWIKGVDAVAKDA